MSIEIEREKLERMLMLLAVATFHTPALQAERTELVEAGLKALAAPVQEPVAHCEAGPEFCPVCRAETRSLALAAAVGYIQRNTPTLVWTEICRALDKSSPAAQPAPVQQILEAFPLLDDEGLDQDEHHCEWALQQDRKRLHAMLAHGITTPPAAQRQWVSLTDYEKLDLISDAKGIGGRVRSDAQLLVLLDMQEAKLKEKNT